MIFNIFDSEKTGYISKENLAVISKATGANLSKWQIERILSNCSASKKNVSFDEFYLLMTRETADGPLREETLNKFVRMNTMRNIDISPAKKLNGM